MSGERESRVNIPQREFNRLQQNAKRADCTERENQRLRREQQAEQKRHARLENTVRQQEQRAQNHETRMNSLGQDMQTMAKEQQKQFTKQRREYQKLIQDSAAKQRAYMDKNFKTLYKDMDKLAQDTDKKLKNQRNEYIQLFKEQDQRMRQALKDQENRLQRNINNLASKIDERWQKQEDIAQQWIGALKEQTEFIRENYRHKQFAPGELDKLISRLNAAQLDISQNMPQSAVPEAREAFRQSLALQQEIELIEARWDELYELAGENLQELFELYNEHKEYPLVLEEQTDSLNLDVDYWTEGEWQTLLDQLQTIKDKLEKEKNSLQCEDLEKILLELDEIAQKLPELDAKAKTALIASVKRRDIQAQICDSLAEIGYNLEDSTYAGEDFRQSYHLKMSNAEQEKIVTIIEPEQSDQGISNKLQFHFYDRSPNDAIREERLQNIQQSLTEQGLEMTIPVCVPEYRGDNAADEHQDFAKVKAQQKAKA